MRLEENRIKDAELCEIMRDFKDMKFDFQFMKRMFVCAKELISRKYEKMNELRELFYNIGRSVFNMRFEFPKDDIRHNIAFHGNHDYNVVLARDFEGAFSFYAQWIQAVEIFVTSEGKVYPRYVPEIRTRKNTEGGGFCVINNVLLTKEDIDDKEIIRRCQFPYYYAIPDNNMRYGTPEEQMELFKRCLGDMWEEAFERYKETEYPIHQEIERNTEKYKSLSETVRIKF